MRHSTSIAKTGIPAVPAGYCVDQDCENDAAVLRAIRARTTPLHANNAMLLLIATAKPTPPSHGIERAQTRARSPARPPHPSSALLAGRTHPRCVNNPPKREDA